MILKPKYVLNRKYSIKTFFLFQHFGQFTAVGAAKYPQFSGIIK